MINTILGSKDRMSQTFIGMTKVPLTWVKASPCVVTQVKTQERDGYFAVQLGFKEKNIKNMSKQLKGHLKGAIKDNKAPYFLREVRFTENPDLKVGDTVNITDVFKKGDIVQVAGVSKGKGFAGAVKRWGFHGGPRTHGQSDRERAPGSIGQGTTPGRVYKGKKMAGRMGNERVSIKNLTVVDINADKHMLAISGSIPGRYGGLLFIKKIGQGKLEELEEEIPVAQIEQVEEEADGKKDEAKESPKEEPKDNGE